MRRIVSAMLLVLALPNARPQVPVRDAGQMDSRHTTFNISELNGIPVAGRTNALVGLDYEALVNVSVDHRVYTLHRLIVDRARHLYYGYDLTALPAEEPSRVRLHFAPLSDLQSFKGVPFETLSAGVGRVPLADRVVDLGVPVILPIITSHEGGTVLADELRFGS